MSIIKRHAHEGLHTDNNQIQLRHLTGRSHHRMSTTDTPGGKNMIYSDSCISSRHGMMCLVINHQIKSSNESDLAASVLFSGVCAVGSRGCREYSHKQQLLLVVVKMCLRNTTPATKYLPLQPRYQATPRIPPPYRSH